MDALKEVASSVKEIRTRLGLRQKDMVNFGFSLRHYQDLESGRSNMTIITLHKLAKAFNVPLSDFFIPLEKNKTEKVENLSSNPFFGYFMWKLTDKNCPKSFILEGVSGNVAELLNFELENNKGKKILDLFPAVEQQSQHVIYHNVMTSGQSVKVKDIVYGDNKIPIAIFQVWAYKHSDNLLCAFFENITKEKMSEKLISENKLINY